MRLRRSRPGTAWTPAVVGDGVLYFSRLVAKASQSQLTRIVSLPSYQQMTIRNWRTTTTLLRMLDERSAD